MSNASRPGPRPYWRWIIVVALWTVLALGLTWIARQIDWSAVVSEARRADPVWLAAAVFTNLLAVPFWAGSWWFLVRRGTASYLALLEALYLILAAVQTFSLLAGVALGMALLVRRTGFSKPAALSLLALDQIVTGIVKVFILAVALALTAVPGVVMKGGAALVMLVVVAGVVLVVAAHGEARLLRHASSLSGRSRGILAFLAAWTSYLEPLRRPGRTAGAVALSLLRRIAEGAGALCVQKALGLPVSFELSWLIMTALALVTVIPQPPGGIGLYEAAVVLVYQFAGYPTETAVAAALLQHVASLAPATLPGYAIAAVRRPWDRRSEFKA